MNLTLCFACGMLLAGSASALELQLEADAYTECLDFGGIQVGPVDCSGASGGVALEGIDQAGEWIAWDLFLEARQELAARVLSAGGNGYVRAYAIDIWYEDEARYVMQESMVTPAGLGIS
jgi:hypothetical protein